jgi:hypothetical protein
MATITLEVNYNIAGLAGPAPDIITAKVTGDGGDAEERADSPHTLSDSLCDKKYIKTSVAAEVGDTVQYFHGGDLIGAGKVQLLSETLSTIGVQLDGITSDIEADLFIDSTTTPWELVYIEKGTGVIGVGTELLRKSMKEIDGSNITESTKVVGQHVHKAL